MFEFLLLLVVLTPLISSRCFRNWLDRLTRTEKQMGTIILLLMITFQFIDLSRNTFPFVRWSMYTEVFEPAEMSWGKVSATLRDGSTTEVNPTQLFPSINRCFAERFQNIVTAARQDKLTELGEQTYQRLLTAIGEQYNRKHPENPAVSLKVGLDSVSYADHKTISNIEWITTFDLATTPNHQP